ncbi:hypothetical protein Lser_V15G37098 [Lactuca serriola]
MLLLSKKVFIRSGITRSSRKENGSMSSSKPLKSRGSLS